MFTKLFTHTQSKVRPAQLLSGVPRRALLQSRPIKPTQHASAINSHSTTPLRAFSSMQQQETASSEVMAARREAHQLRTEIPRGKNRVPYNIKVGDSIQGFKVESIEEIPLSTSRPLS